MAEVFGTFVLVFAGLGTAIYASAFPTSANAVGVGYLGVALAFGLAVIGAAYAVGHVSGGHFNPAVTFGLAIGRRIEWRAVPAYIGAQVIGAALGTSLIAAIAAGGPGDYLGRLERNGFASNGYGAHSPGRFDLLSVVLIEFILTALFVYVILGVTDRPAVSGFAPLAIGLTLTLIHLASIPVSNTSVNPARSIASAIWGGAPALAQLWVFILVPLAGAAAAGLTYKPLFSRLSTSAPASTAASTGSDAAT